MVKHVVCVMYPSAGNTQHFSVLYCAFFVSHLITEKPFSSTSPDLNSSLNQNRFLQQQWPMEAPTFFLSLVLSRFLFSSVSVEWSVR